MPTTIADVMTSRVLVVPPNLGLKDAARFLLQHSVSSAPVVDDDGRVVGMLSKTDLVRHGVLGHGEVYLRPKEIDVGSREVTLVYAVPHKAGPPDDIPVSEVMMPLSFSVKPDDPAMTGVRMMVDGRLHRLMVTEGDRLVGLISALDMVETLSEGAEGLSR